MLNTGIRLGEAIGLKKTDWNKGESTLHIQRNIQSISKRDNGGNRVQGKQLVANTTKTYSGDRIIPLNKAATEAIQRLCEQHPDAECIICSSKGDMIPPERLERTFYRILKNVGINQAGLHSLRHPYVKHTTKNIPAKAEIPNHQTYCDGLGFRLFQLLKEQILNRTGHGLYTQSQCACPGKYRPSQSGG